MNIRNTLSLLILTVASILLSSTTYALAPSSITNIYVFGDSLSDCGFQDNLKTTGHPNNTWTTPFGNIWSQQLGHDFGRPLTPNNDYKAFNINYPNHKVMPGINVTQNLDGNCYAAGGAVTSGTGIGTPGKYEPPSVNDQVKNYLLQHSQAEPHALYIIWAGANNILKVLGEGKTDPSSYATAEQTATTDIVNEVTELRQAGATHVMVISLPDLSKTPLIGMLSQHDSSIITMMHAVSLNFNILLNKDLAGKGAAFFNAYKLLNNIVTSIPYTDEFTGKVITNATEPACKQSGAQAITCIPGPGTENYMFEDVIHPTAVTGDILANHIEQKIEQSSF